MNDLFDISWVSINIESASLPEFQIMKYPVTNAQYCNWLNKISKKESAAHYCELMGEHFFGGILRQNNTFLVKPGYQKKPVVFVSWYDAKSFSEYVGGRLPTESEWRHAAAWLPNQCRLAKWCTGADVTPSQKEAVFYDDTDGWALPAPHIADVDWYQPSGAYGLCGMAGNVGEWVDDGYKNGWKFALGGSVFRPVEQTLTSSEEADSPNKRLSTFGFRVARSLN